VTASELGLSVAMAVLGLDNPVIGDDAVGLYVAAEAARLDRESPVDGLTVVTNPRAGFELIYALAASSSPRSRAA
jgi:Ni,Fe-hydrogenase maturation factor